MFAPLLLILPIVCGSASAESPGAAEMDFNSWYCVDSVAALGAFEVNGAGFRVRDVIVREGEEFGAPTINFSATATNRSDQAINMTITYIGQAGDQPAFGLSSSQLSGHVPPGVNRVIDASVYAQAGALAGATRHCIRVDAFR